MINHIVLRKEKLPSPLKAIHIQRNLWTVPREYLDKKLFSRYYILKWSSEYFFSLLYNKENTSCTIQHDGVDYMVQFYRCTPIDCKKAMQLFLSFRELREEYGEHRAVVLVTPA